MGVTIQYVGVSLRGCKSGTIRGLRGWRAGRQVKALILVPSRPDRDSWHTHTAFLWVMEAIGKLMSASLKSSTKLYCGLGSIILYTLSHYTCLQYL